MDPFSSCILQLFIGTNSGASSERPPPPPMNLRMKRRSASCFSACRRLSSSRLSTASWATLAPLSASTRSFSPCSFTAAAIIICWDVSICWDMMIIKYEFMLLKSKCTCHCRLDFQWLAAALLVLLTFREFLPAHRRFRQHQATTVIIVLSTTTAITSTIFTSPHVWTQWLQVCMHGCMHGCVWMQWHVATASIHTPTRCIAGADMGTAGGRPLYLDLHKRARLVRCVNTCLSNAFTQIHIQECRHTLTSI